MLARARLPASGLHTKSVRRAPQVSVMVADATRLVQDAQNRHKSAPTATAALGRALCGALLMGCFRKDDEVVQLNFNGRGPLGQLTAIADTYGRARGYVQNPSADPPLRPDGKLDVGTAVGAGVLSVVRTHPRMKEPYTGVVPIHSGEVAEDLAVYLADSEQMQAAVGVGVLLDRQAQVTSAGGFLVSVLPSADDFVIAALETNLSQMRSVSELLAEGKTPEDIARIIAGGMDVQLLGDVEPTYGPCEEDDLRQRMRRAVATLGERQVREIIAEQGFLEVTCEFCKTSYRMAEDEIEEILVLSSEFDSSAAP